MKILCIPFDKPGQSKSDPRFIPIMLALSLEHELVGVQRFHYFNKRSNIANYFTYIRYMLNTFIFGLRHSKSIDLIICENQVAPHALIGGIIAVLTRKPCIWDSHGNILEYCREANRSKLITFMLTVSEKISGKMIKTMVVPSETDKKLYIEQNFKKNSIIVLPSGIDISEVDKVFDTKINLRKKLGLDLEKIILLFTGRGSYIPNMEALHWISQTLAPTLAKKFQNVQILIIGPWDTSLKVHPIVQFTGFVPSLYEYLLAADLCLAPMRLENGISTKVIEYMACAKPVVASQSVVKGTPQMIDGENSLIARNSQEFIDKTLYILENPVGANKIGLEARKVIEKYYNWQIISSQWNKLVMEIASQK